MWRKTRFKVFFCGFFQKNKGPIPNNRMADHKNEQIEI